MAKAQTENGYGNTNAQGTGYGAPVGNYQYNPIGENQKERYAYQPTIAEAEQPGPAELGAHRPVHELPGGNLPSSGRY